MLCAGDEIAAVLDWELARVRDPLFDIGYIRMPFLASKIVDRPSPLLNGLAEHEWVYERYERLTGRTLDPFALDYWTAMALFSMVTIHLTGLHHFDAGEPLQMDHAWIHNAWIQYTLPGFFEDIVDILRAHVDDSRDPWSG
jgi:aminoglycoside phosphotransferase (APT) family kinase protein